MEVAPGVFVHTGHHVTVDDPDHGDIANIGFIVGQRCVAVIDTGGSLATGQRLLDSIRATTATPICYVINTHGHYDHVLGNVAFASIPGIVFVGHESLPASMAASTPLFLRQFAADLGPRPASASIVAPSVVVADTREIDLGGRRLTLAAHPLAHTDADLTVLDETTGTLWTGDLVFMERIPVLDGSILGWLDVLDQMRHVDAHRIVPGHGPASAPWPAASVDAIRYLVVLRDDVRAGIAAGRFMEDVMASAATSERQNWQLFDDYNGRNVSRAFTELEWE